VIHSFQAFEVELILGFPIRFFVFGTQTYFLMHQEPPLFQSAAALSTLVIIIMLPLIWLQRRATRRRSFTTVSSKSKNQMMRLGKWRTPAFLAVLTVGLTITVVPFTLLLMGTFMRLFGFFRLPQAWSTMHWGQVLDDPIFLRSLTNTLVLAGCTAALGVVLFTLIAYIVTRKKFKAQGPLDFISWLPSTLPGIILAVGLLWLFLGNPVLRGMYGTILVLIIGTTVGAMTTSTQIIKSNFAQLSAELEEAARVGGGSWLQAFRYAVLPLITPTLLLVAALSFVHAARDVSTVALLATSTTRPLSLLQLDFMVEGRYEAAAVTGVIIVMLTTGVALVASLLGRRRVNNTLRGE
jgi:iron(III) transport system permease protein